ncbi:MAG: SDR family NAD(P)-dependent oxidoreductase [Gemmatimonas sp.]|uniref:SDR family NAD(P)-dependent oxidoreductase n=1 Tax=Gemmatimonas sp. TaxID=1962908 RepID=UPI00391F9F00
MPWTNTVAFITGAGSGIGRALSLELARRGAQVVVADIDGEAAERVAAAAGAGARAGAVDVRDAERLRAAIEGAASGGRLDLLVNNAGIGVSGEVHEIPLAHWERILDINVRGVVHGVAAGYPIMVRQGHGHILNVASLAGLGPAPLFTPYAMTKHAVVGLSTSLRIEAAVHGVQVHVLCPSAIETPLLDSTPPADLPAVPWRPDTRRLLEAFAGPPYGVEALARETLDAVERNEGIIVRPSRARFLWRLGRWFPALVERGGLAAVERERRARR